MESAASSLPVESAASSLPVPNVQALAASTNGSDSIPDRYITHEAGADPVATYVDVELPVIDLSRLLDGEYTLEESLKLEHACVDWGFFQLINHGVPSKLIDKMKEDTIEFFKLPLKEKEAFGQISGSIEGYGQAFIKSEEQKLDWADMLILVTSPLSLRSMKFWPTHPPTFRNTLDTYTSAVKEVANILLELMAKNLGLAPEIILDKFTEEMQSVRLNYYPPCLKADKVIGLSPHSDATGLTVLLQVTDVPGLQIKKNGEWFPIEPLPGAFVVNIGDTLEIWSNGKYKSIEHRAVINIEKERLSIAAFHGSNYDSVIGPLPELVKGAEEQYKSMKCLDYMNKYFSAKLDGRSQLESMKFGK